MPAKSAEKPSRGPREPLSRHTVSMIRRPPRAVPAAPAAALLDTPYQYTLVPGELYEGPNMELSAMPAALALTFTYNGHTYTCTAYPAEVTP